MSVRDSSVVQLIVRTASANALIFQRTGAFSIGVNKLAMAYKNGDFAICLNGTAVQTDTSNITMPSVSINKVSLGESALYVLNQQLPTLSCLSVNADPASCLRNRCSMTYLCISPLHVTFRQPQSDSSQTVSKAISRLSRKLSPLTYLAAYAPFKPSDSG